MAVDVEYDEDDRIFVPPIVELVDFQLPGKLSASYADVREAVRKTHESVYEMWGAVFEFAIVCKENEDDLNRFCEQQGIGARDKTSEFTRAVKIAISTPAITKSGDELKFDKAQVSRFCHIFDLAVERDNVQTGPEFVTWLRENGGVKVALGEARRWRSRHNLDTLAFSKDAIFNIRLMKRRLENEKRSKKLFGKKPDLSAFDLEDGGHYSLHVSIVDGVPVVDAHRQLPIEIYNVAIQSSLPTLDAMETPLRLAAFLSKLCAASKTYGDVSIVIKDGWANCTASGGPKSKPEFAETYLLDPEVPDAKFKLKAGLKENLAKATKVFPQKSCLWELSSEKITIVTSLKPDGAKFFSGDEMMRIYSDAQPIGPGKYLIDTKFVKYGKTKTVTIKF